MRAALTRIGFALGGTASARLACSLGLPTSDATVLRLVRAMPGPPVGTPRVLGIDDWAWRKGARYGTMICDLEQHHPVDLLPDRAPKTVAAWLRAHPSITVISRDRGDTYIEGATRGAPNAVQVADRFHLVKNLGEAVEAFLHHKRPALNRLGVAAGASVPTVPQLQPWQVRAEEESQRRHAQWLARYVPREPRSLTSPAVSRSVARRSTDICGNRERVHAYAGIHGDGARAAR